MASYRGIGSAAQAVIEVLRDSWEPAKARNGAPFGPVDADRNWLTPLRIVPNLGIGIRLKLAK